MGVLRMQRSTAQRAFGIRPEWRTTETGIGDGRGTIGHGLGHRHSLVGAQRVAVDAAAAPATPGLHPRS